MQEKNITSNNGWQNQGICINFALDNLDPKYQTLFNVIVKLSFGYKKLKTNKMLIMSIKIIIKTPYQRLFIIVGLVVKIILN